MVSTKELRVIFLYAFQLGNSAAHATRYINTVFGDGTVNERTVQRWFEKFRCGEKDLNNKPRGKPPVLVDDNVLRALVEANPSRTLSSLAEELGMCCKTIGNHLKNMGKMSDTKAADTVPGLGFKDKEKALETIKTLEGRDPDYQKFAVKGLIGRANRTLSITKAEDKLTNIKDALKVFEEWLSRFEKMNLSKENMAYLPLATIEVFAPLQSHYDFDNSKFIQAYKKAAEGDYKRLRTVESGDGEPTWDIVRNTNLKKMRKEMESNDLDLWNEDGIPTKIHAQMIMWAYSPENSKIKKTISTLEEKIQKLCPVKKSDTSDDDSKSDNKKEKSLKRKSGGGDKSSDSDEEETPQKKKRSSSSDEEDDEED